MSKPKIKEVIVVEGKDDVSALRRAVEADILITTGGSERSGMGFTIMESFMTSFDVSSSPNKGTTVHMKRRIMQRGTRA